MAAHPGTDNAARLLLWTESTLSTRRTCRVGEEAREGRCYNLGMPGGSEGTTRSTNAAVANIHLGVTEWHDG